MLICSSHQHQRLARFFLSSLLFVSALNFMRFFVAFLPLYMPLDGLYRFILFHFISLCFICEFLFVLVFLSFFPSSSQVCVSFLLQHFVTQPHIVIHDISNCLRRSRSVLCCLHLLVAQNNYCYNVWTNKQQHV